MPAVPRPRGATSTNDQKISQTGSRVPSGRIWAGICIVAISAIVVLNLPSENAAPKNQISSPKLVENTALAQEIITLPVDEAPKAEPPATPEPLPWVDLVVQSGDNLSLIFKRAGYNDRDVHNVVTGSSNGKLLARIFPGQTISFKADDTSALTAVRYEKSPLETITYQRGEQGFDSAIELREPELREAWATGVIESSLYLAGMEAGLSQNLIMELANVFGGVIDFVMDPRKGDTIHLIYEDLYLDGQKFEDGNIIAASFTNQGETFNAYRYTDTQGDVNYYNDDGVSMRKAFLLAPVDFTRISSGFNPGRLHPIYKTKRPHRGTDYAAPTGTPIFATGDGRIAQAGYNNANGNYVFIQHGDQYITKYLHLQKRNVKKGQKVSQSQIIGTVGSTGAATGPHLHYEFLVNGVHRNPRTIHKSLPKAKSLPSNEMARFRQAINQSSLQLAALRSDNRLAMSEQADSDAKNH